MNKSQFNFQVKKKLLLFGCLFLAGILAILYFSSHPPTR
jgi:sensor domain CHASE-containing protein